MGKRKQTGERSLLVVARKLLAACPQELGWFFLWLALMVVSAVLRVRVTRILGFTGDAVLSGQKDYFMNQLNVIVLLCAGMIFAGMIIAYVSGKYKTNTTARLSARTAQALTGASYGWLQQQKSGDLIQRANSDTNLAADLINGWLPDLFNALVQVAAVAFFIITLDFRLALAYFGAIPVAILGQTLVSKPIERTRKVAMAAEAQTKSHISDTLHRVDTVKAYSLEDTMQERVEERIGVFKKADLKAWWIYCAVVPAGFVCAFLPSLCLYLTAIHLVL
jgi:ABC-type multidrug transport system fused ATPase/permease subunit